MKIITKIAVATLAIIMLISAASCGNSSDLPDGSDPPRDTSSGTTETKESSSGTTEAQASDTSNIPEGDQFRLRVVDIDGEVLADDILSCENVIGLTDTLKNDYALISYDAGYGTTILSVAGSVVDVNYYVSIFENGSYAMVGVDGLTVDPGDFFEFKVECWNTVESGYGTMDEYDVLVDKAVYHYAKKILPSQILNASSYNGSLFWDQAAAAAMIDGGYDEDLFTLDYTEEFIASLEDADISSLSGSDFLKYYYSATSAGIGISNEFKSAFAEALESSCTDWMLPVAKALGLSSDQLIAHAEAAPSTDLTLGPDVSIWSYVLKGLYVDHENYTDIYTSRLDWGNGTSTALVIMALAKDGIDPRQEQYEKDGKDAIEALFDGYYDAELKLLKVYPTDTGINFSTNQIYASLMAYKLFRDSGSAVNIFA